jgi:asparagine synthase (glutamine-hydrolysing)
MTSSRECSEIKNNEWSYYYEDACLSLGFLGDVYGLEEDKSIIHVLLENYKKHGVKAFFNLNGHYVIALLDKIRDNLYIVNDRYGFKRYYYWFNNERLLFSHDLKKLISYPEVSKKLDIQAIADFLYLGFILDDKTLFKEIKLLPPASVLCFSNGEITIEKYWDYSFNNIDKNQFKEDDCLKEFYEILKRAIEIRIKGSKELILPISGGLDSRTIAGIIKELDYDGIVKTFSYGNRYCYDVIYGNKISKKLGYNHSFIPISSDYLEKFSEKFVITTKGEIDCLNSHLMIFHDIFKENNSLSIINGFLGDVLTGVNFKPEWKTLKNEDLIKKTFEISENHLNELKNYLKKNIYERIFDVTLPALKKYFKNSNNSFYNAHYLTLSQRQRRYVAFNIFCYEQLGKVITPFTDNNFIDFASKLSEKNLTKQNLYKKMIIKYLPEVASVPYEKTRMPLNASRIREGLQWRWDRLNRKPFIKATFGRKYAKYNNNYLNSDYAIRTGSKDFVMRCIKDNIFLTEYLYMDKVINLLEEHLNGKKDEREKITKILTLSIFSNIFL